MQQLEKVGADRNTNRRCNSAGLCWALGLISLCSSGAAFAAGDDDAGLEEIIVSAERVEESLQETSISVTALTGEQLDTRGIGNITDLNGFAPNVYIHSSVGPSGGGNTAGFFIRGIGQIDHIVTQDPGVGIYVDGVYLGRAQGAALDLVDLERIEVLRGPQGTLYGRNTIGGAINLVPAKPSEDFFGKADLTLGNFGRNDIRASVNIPLSETVFMKIAGNSKNRDGYIDRVNFETGEKFDEEGDENAQSIRTSFRWLASDDVELNYVFDHARIREKGLSGTLSEFNDSAALLGFFNAAQAAISGADPITSAYLPPNPFTSYGTGPNYDNVDVEGHSLTIDWRASDILALKSITAFRSSDSDYGREGDSTPGTINHTLDVVDVEQVSQELQLSGSTDRLQYIVGLFHLEEKSDQFTDVRLLEGTEVLVGAPVIWFDTSGLHEITTTALYGQVTWSATDALDLTLGIRFSDEQKDYDFRQVSALGDGTVQLDYPNQSQDWTTTDPKVSVKWRVNDDAMLYASYAEGFKGGGYTPRPLFAVDELPNYDPEEVANYEFGVKSNWLDNRLRINAAAFFSDYTNLQLSAPFVDTTASGAPTLGFVTDNAGKAEIKGIEIELEALLADSVYVSASYGYIDFEITEISAGVQAVTLDTIQPKTPENTFSLSADYTTVFSAGELLWHADLRFTDKVYHDVNNTESLAQDAFTLANARIVYTPNEENWHVALFGTNLSDKNYKATGWGDINSFGQAQSIYGRPREFGLTVGVNF